MKPFIPFAVPEIGQEEIDEVVACLKSGWITTGPRVSKFEEDFSSYIGSKHSIAVSSATAGLHLALEAIGIKDGDKVMTSPFTFTSTAEVINYLGADPVFIDIDPRTFNIDHEKIEAYLSSMMRSGEKLPKAIIPVHFGGQSCEMDKICELAQKYSMMIVEDAAHALPAEFMGKMIGTIGDITVYSFYATKTITTGEGGMVVTNNDKLAERMRCMRLHGISNDVYNRYQSSTPSWYYEVIAPGYKYNMSDISAALGIHQLRKAEEFRLRREKIAIRYNEQLDGLPLRTPFVSNKSGKHAWHLYVIQLELEQLEIDRDRFIEKLCDLGIGTSVHFIPLHIQPYWRDRYNFSASDYPVSYDIFKRVISLPIYPKMTDSDINRVVQGIQYVSTECDTAVRE